MCIGSEHEQQIERYPSTKHVGPPRKYGLFLFPITLCLVMQKVCHNDLRPKIHPPSFMLAVGGYATIYRSPSYLTSFSGTNMSAEVA